MYDKQTPYGDNDEVDDEDFISDAQYEELHRHLRKKLDDEDAGELQTEIYTACSYYHEYLLEQTQLGSINFAKLKKALNVLIDNIYDIRFPYATATKLRQNLLQIQLQVVSQELLAKKPKGAPRKFERNDLIRDIYCAYPIELAKKTEGSHFERTIEMVLGFFGEYPSDLHKTILLSLKGDEHDIRGN